MDAIDLAESVVGLYTMQRVNAALYSQKVCGCRSCAARAKAWVIWVTGEEPDSDVSYTGHQLPSSGYGQFA
jgi:hypothetical protein